MITITPADALVLCGAFMTVLGLVEPTKLLTKMRMDAATLVVAGVLVALVGFILSVFIGR